MLLNKIENKKGNINKTDYISFSTNRKGESKKWEKIFATYNQQYTNTEHVQHLKKQFKKQNNLTKYKKRYFLEAGLWVPNTNKKKRSTFSEIKEKQIKTIVRSQLNHLIVGKNPEKSEKAMAIAYNNLNFFQTVCKQFGIMYTFKKCAYTKAQLFSSYIYMFV